MAARNDRVAWTAEQDAYLVELSEQGYLAPAAAQMLAQRFGIPRNASAVRLRRTYIGCKVNPNGMGQRGVEQPKAEQSIEVKDAGEYLNVTSYGSEVRTIDELVARAKIDLTRYEVDRPETSMHETTIRDPDGNIRKVQNFRIVAKFRLKAGPSTKEQVEALIAGAFGKRPATSKKSLQVRKRTDGIMQAVVIADPHLAKYAWARETGWDDYDLSIASRLVNTAADELLAWGDETRPAVRHIWLLGDILHYDNPQGHTTGGTPQDRDTRLAKMLEEAASVLCGIVERSARTCQTQVVMVPGNHDRASTLAMQLILAAYFRGDTRVSVDIEPTHRKYVEWGHCLIGLTHGDTARRRLPTLMQVERKEAWGRSRVREWHHGHLHREAQTVTEGGVTIREHLSLSPPDSWHAVEGYVGAPRGMDSFLYAHEGFVRGMWRSPVLDG